MKTLKAILNGVEWWAVTVIIGLWTMLAVCWFWPIMIAVFVGLFLSIGLYTELTEH